MAPSARLVWNRSGASPQPLRPTGGLLHAKTGPAAQPLRSGPRAPPPTGLTLKILALPRVTLDWLERLIAIREGEDPRASVTAAARAVERLVARGVVAVGDIANGPTAIDALARSGLHAVVFHEVFRLRADDATRDTKVLILTAHAQPEVAVQAQEGGADDFMTKPFRPTDLRDRVAKMIAS